MERENKMKKMFLTILLLASFVIFACEESDESYLETEDASVEYSVSEEGTYITNTEESDMDVDVIQSALSSCLLQTYFEIEGSEMLVTPTHHTDGNDTSITFCAGSNDPIVLYLSLYRERWWWTDILIGSTELWVTQGQVPSHTWNNILSNKDYYFKVQQLWGDYAEGHYGIVSQ